jgi:hypothetical protein
MSKLLVGAFDDTTIQRLKDVQKQGFARKHSGNKKLGYATPNLFGAV